MPTKDRTPDPNETVIPSVPNGAVEAETPSDANNPSSGPEHESTGTAGDTIDDDLTIAASISSTDATAGDADFCADDATRIEEARPPGTSQPASTGKAERDRFRLIDNFARGGLGNIWRAEDGRIRRDVAFKELLPKALKSSVAVSRFLEEAQITGQLEHPGIVPIYELGFQANGTPYYTMKLVRGDTFDAAIKAYHAMPSNSAERNRVFIRLLRNFIDICNTLAFAHDHNVIHRDLKPQNVMLGQFGETLVLDWGLAKVIKVEHQDITAEFNTTSASDESDTKQLPGNVLKNQSRESQSSTTSPTEADNCEATVDSVILTRIDAQKSPANESLASSGVMRREVSVTERTRGTETLDGSVLGTPAYMAPEQARGEHDTLDCRADIYALGAILYRLLTNTTPLGKGSIRQIIARAKDADFKPPREHDSAIPRALEAICQKAMKKAPEDRYQSALDLKEDVESWLADEPVRAYPDPFLLRLRRWIRRYRTAVLSGAAVLVTATVVPFAIKAVRHDRLTDSVTQRFKNADAALVQHDYQTAASLLDEAAGLLADEPELGDLASQVERKRSTVAAVLSRNELEQEQLRRAESEAARQIAELNYARAERERKRANRNFIVASSQRLVAESKAVRQSHPRLSMLLSVEAVELSRRRQEMVVPEALQNLHDVAAAFGGTGQSGHDDQIRDSAISTDGRWLLTGSKDRTARLWDLESIDLLRTSIELTGHEGAINCVALPAGDRWAVTAGDDADVVVWDLTAADINSAPIVLKGHELPVTCMAVSMDGRLLATSGIDTDIRLWDLTNADVSQSVRLLKGHKNTVNQLRFSPSGDRIFSASEDGIVSVWPVRSANDPAADQSEPILPERQLRKHLSGVLSLAVSPSGNWLVSGDAQGSVLAWNLRSDMLEPFPMAGHRRAVTEVSFASDAVAVTDKPSNTERLATAGTDGIVVVWELSENGPRQLAEFQDHVGAVNDLAWNSSGTKLVSAGDDRTVRLRHWNVADSRNADNSVSTLLAHEDAVWTLAVGVDRLTSGALDGAVQLWNLAREEPGITPVVLRNHRRTIQNVSASRDGQSLLALSSDRDHTWSLWNRDVETEFSLVDTSRFHDVISRASASAWSPQSQTAAIAGSDSLIMLLTVAGREVTSRKVEVPDASINAMIFSADGLKLFFVGNSGVFGNIDLASRESNAAAGQLTTSRMGDSDLVSIAAASQGEQLAIGTEDGGVVLWSSEDQWKLLPGSHRDAITDLAFSPDGNLLASVSGDRSAHVWKRSPDGTFMASPLVLVMHKERIRAAAFTPDSRTLLTVSDDETAILWPLNSDSPEKEATILIGHESAIHACAISDDGRWAITGSDDGTVRLWDLDSDNPSASVVIMYNFGEPVRAIDLIDQSRTLVAGTRNGELFVWPLDPDELLNRVRLSAGRSLSPQEMQQFKTAAGGVDDDTRQIDGSRSQ